MDWLISIIYIVVVLGVLVIAHEWGHFYVAKLCKMRVDDFSLFFGPRIWRIGKFDGTEYNVRCIPMGGFVKIAGMEPEESDAHIFAVPSAFGVSAATAPKSKTMVGLREEALEGISSEAIGESIKAKVDEAIGPNGKLTEEGRAILNNSGAVESDERRYIAAILEADKYRPDPSLYNQKPLWQRASVIAAGPIMSLLFGYIIFCVMGVTIGLPYDGKLDNLVETIRSKKMPAYLAGIRPGDRVVRIDGAPISDGMNMISIINNSIGKALNMVVLRDGKEQSFTVTPIADTQDRQDKTGKTVKKVVGVIGITPKSQFLFKRYSPIGAVQRGSELVVNQVVGTLTTIFSKKVGENAGGIIRITNEIHEGSKEGPRQVLLLAAILSLSLGIMNLFPIPVLDGGHLMLLTWEGLRRRKLTVKEVVTAQLVGLSIIGVLFVLMMYNDFVHIILKRI